MWAASDKALMVRRYGMLEIELGLHFPLVGILLYRADQLGECATVGLAPLGMRKI